MTIPNSLLLRLRFLFGACACKNSWQRVIAFVASVLVNHLVETIEDEFAGPLDLARLERKGGQPEQHGGTDQRGKTSAVNLQAA